MQEDNQNILEAAEDYVLQQLGEKLDSKLVYHSPAHTCEVVEATKLLAHHTSLDKLDTEMVTLAAWFHDMGFVVKYEDHENNSLIIARKFLEEYNYPESKIEIVLNCISVTKMDVEPTNILEEVICDADLYHISTSDCLEKAGFLRKEWELFRNEIYTDKEWYSNTIKFYQSHKYYTPYGKSVLQKGKDANIKNLIDLAESIS